LFEFGKSLNFKIRIENENWKWELKMEIENGNWKREPV
jgi:hypothetical protein